MLVYGNYECFVKQMLYVCVLCASCGSSQRRILHDLQFVNAVRGCKRRPYGKGLLQSRSHDCLIGSHECLLLFTPSYCCECFYQWGPIYQQQVTMYITTPFVNPLFICFTLNRVCLHSFPTSSSFVSSNRILPFVYTFSGIFVELLKVIQSAGMC